MGLMLSVLVFCVGVAEILDCWHHFLLHLVQPQYNPLPCHLDLKSDYLSDREILHPLSESRRTSNVDICWPKDLSPDDNLHVIKKRPHGDATRGSEHDFDSSHRVVRKHGHNEIDISFSTSPESVLGSSPYIIVHSPEPPDLDISPIASRETSPNRLELGVIVESDSSSEVDEPSQIENVNYKNVKASESLEQEEEIKDLFRGGKLIVNEVSDKQRPKCPSATILEQECDSDSTQQVSEICEVEKAFESETSSLPELPVFTGDILSHDVKKVNVQYPSNAKSINVASLSSNAIGNEVSNVEVCKFVKSNESNEANQNTETNNNRNVLPISTILDEGLEPISEFPEITVQESSPIPPEDDSDSSLNTSDASWMVRSKTSDRPLIIRFDTCPEKVQQDFQSVVQTDLRALGNKEHENKGSKTLEKVDSVDTYYDALANQTGLENLGEFQNEMRLEETTNSSEKFYSEEVFNEADVMPSSVNFVHIDSNSSSSSLSGIPQLPEDTFESLSQTPLPTDNGYSPIIDVSLTDIPDLNKDSFATSLLTSDVSDENKNENNITSEPKSNEKEDLKVDLPPDVLSVKSLDSSGSENRIEKGISTSGVQNTSSKIDNIKKKEISVAPDILKELNISEKQCKDNKNSVYSVENKGTHQSVTLEDSVSPLKITNESSSLNADSDRNLMVSTSQENVVSQKELQTISNEGDKTNSEEIGLDILQKQTSSNKLSPECSAVNSSTKNTTNIISASLQSPSCGFNCAVTSPTYEIDKPNIPTPQENAKSSDSPKEILTKSKEKTSKKQKAKSSSKSSSTESSDAVVLCCTKTLDEKTNEDNRVSVKTNSPNDTTESAVKPGTSKSSEEPKPSTSKSEEDKAFWLIFSGEYTKAMNKDWHNGHFCCWQCDETLTGQRYVLRDEHPYCVKCYESVFANGCEECSKTIGIDSKDLSYKDKHWHEACFLCNKCRVSLVDKQFGSKLDKIFCGNCYDQQFASRCDGCGQIFKAGTKKMEYKTRQWHEPCFSCCVCKSAIGTKSFIPREQEIYCATCYEEKFATRCVKCNKIITSGGVTYKNEPWHRECFTCTHCSTSLAGQRFTSRDEKPYCAECFGELFAKRCTACSKPITGIGGTRFISFEDRHWHNDCFICASCKTSLVGRGFITDGDDIICPECAKQKLM